MKDVNAKRGFIVCTSGVTKSAKRRAQKHIGIKLLSKEDLETFSISSWDNCKNFYCNNGLVLWDLTPGVILNGVVTVQAIGKCDECGKFHVWCWGCGNKNALEIEDDWQCACEEPWFWLTSIEPEEDDNGNTNQANYLILVLGTGMPHILDRRPL